MAFGDADLAALLADFGTSWRFGATTAVGILDEADETRPGPEGVGDFQGDVRSILFAASDFATGGALAGLAAGSILTQDGTSYTVRAIKREPPDGRLRRVWILEATS